MAVASIHPTNLPALERAVGWIDAPVADVIGRPIGRVKAVLCDAAGRPWWLVLKRRGLRGRTLLAPYAGATEDRGVRLGCRAESLEASPQPGDDELTAESHSQLAAHFGLLPVAKGDRPRGDCRPPRTTLTRR